MGEKRESTMVTMLSANLAILSQEERSCEADPPPDSRPS